ncbi:MAG: glycosyltransferase family 2 protein [Candidatus Tectomicrobia bacterium]|nr:glycosyltransferase family 2 protein [Candidatus Tectomicrobia bacterium]
MSDFSTSQETPLKQPGPPGSSPEAAGETAPGLSIVIPAFNEEQVVSKCLDTVERHARSRGYTYEILVVDDGSADRTREVVRQYMAGKNHIRLLSNEQNRGKGFAVRRGMLAARGDLVLFMDADLSTSPEELDKMKEWIDRGFPVVIGTRRTEGATIARHQSFLREKMGSVFTLLSRELLRIPVSDFTCGFKCFSRDAARTLFSRQTLDDWSFDAEILHIAKRRGIPIKEVPVRWANAEDSKVHLIRDTLRSLLGLFRILRNAFGHRYDR